MHEGRKRTPMPIRERELTACGSGPVITYKLSPEELEMYRATGIFTREEEPMNTLTKEQYLKMRIAGKGRTEIMKIYFKNQPQAFYRQLREWGIKEKDAEDRELELIAPARISPNVELVEKRFEKPVDKEPGTKPALSSKFVNDLASQLELFLTQYGISNAIRSVIEERRSQDAKWGEQNHEPHFWTGILGEEFGELCEVINETVFDNGAAAKAKGGYENMRNEAVQVAAVAVGFIEALDRRYA